VNIHSAPLAALDDAQLQHLLEDCERAAQAWLSPAQIGLEDPEVQSWYWMARAEEVLAEVRRRQR
jgi:hypothetical protein